MKKINSLILMTFFNTTGSGITAGFWFIIAALLLPSEYGEIHYLISIAGISYTISLFGTSEVISVYTAKKIKLQSTLTFISLITGSVAAVIILFLFSKIDLSFLIIAYIINDISIGYLLGKKFFVDYSKYFLLQKGLAFSLGIIFYYVLGFEGIILGLVLSYAHFIIIIYKIQKSSKIDLKELKTKIGFVSTNYSIKLSSIAKNHLDKIIVVPLLGFELLGNYTLALQMYALFMMFSKIIYRYILPHDSTGEDTRKIKITSIVVSVIIMFAGVVLSPIIIPNIFPEYDDAIPAIQIISLAVIPSTLSLIFSSKFLGQENARVVLISRISFSVSFIGLILVLTPIFGIFGASSSFVVSNILQCVIFFVYFKINKKKSGNFQS